MADPVEIETTARNMGWVPKEQFKGDPAKWRSAEDYVSRGENFVPFLQKRVRESESRNQQLQGTVQQQTTQIQELTETVQTLSEYNLEVARKAAREERTRLRRELVQARKDGDVDREAELEEAIAEHDDKSKTIGKKANGNGSDTTNASASNGSAASSASTAGPDPTQDPAFQAWLSRNDWFRTDDVMRAASVAMLGQLNRDPEFQKLSKEQKWEKLSEKVMERFSPGEKPPASKFDGGGGGGGGDEGRRSGNGKGKTYNDLPPAAKRACDRFGRTLVGPNRAFKDMDAWRAKYVSDLPSDFDWTGADQNE